MVCELNLNKAVKKKKKSEFIFLFILYWDIANWGFPGGARGKEPACQCRSHKGGGFDPWVRKIPWRRAWQPTPVFLLENPTERGTWQATVHRVAKSWIQLKQLRTDAL